jgi:predicted AAA+ superfamily ATPase
LKVFPFSFKEFLSYKKLNIEKEYEIITKKKEIKKHLTEYLTYGGFPQIVLEKDISLKNQMLKEIFEGIIYRDIVFRHKIKDAYLVKVIAELAINNFSSLISATKLRNVLVQLISKKISPNYVVNILEYLQEAFLIFQIPIFSFKVKEQKLYPKKIYCIDTGLINAVTTKFTKDFGRIYENIVALYLIKNKGKENIFYWKSSEGYEVDFVIKEGLKINQLIQVCYDIENEKTKEREINSLIKAGKELNCKNLLIITDDYEGKEKINSKTILYKPLWKLLLSEKI